MITLMKRSRTSLASITLVSCLLLASPPAFGAAAGEPAARTAEAADVANAAGMKQGEATHAGHDMSEMQMGAGSQLVYNPAFGDQIYHTHPSGMWMLSYQYMHMDMGGLRDGASAVANDSIGFKRRSRYEFMMIPTKMTMDMQMLMAMYGVTDSWTVMVMPSHLRTKMDMLMDMGPMMGRARPLRCRPGG